MRSAVSFVLAILAVAALAPKSQSSIIMLLHDEFDDRDMVLACRDVKEVKEFGRKMDELKKRLYPLRERDFVALFGKSSAMPAVTYAMPVAQSRGLALSGIRFADEKLNKDHTEFYQVGPVAGIQVYYGITGSPAAILFYFVADDAFARLGKNNLDKRLAWDQQRWHRLVEYFEKRRARIFVWEVDTQAEKKFFQNDHDRSMKTKLESWLASGKKMGYRLEIVKDSAGSNNYSWYRADGTLARNAHSFGKSDFPHTFLWYHTDGKQRIRDEWGGDHTNCWRWCRPDNGANIRYETGNPSTWTWYDKNGNEIRQEGDDNGDGIPDWFSSGRKGKHQDLPLDKSWAVHPELIPEECRIPDQPDRRVPIRKIVVPAARVGPAEKVAPAQLEQWCADLGSVDLRRAFKAMDCLAGVSAQTIPFLAGQVKPDPKVDSEMLAAFIKDLGNDRFEVRDRATRELEKWHWLARPALQQALKVEKTLETRTRIGKLLSKAEAHHQAHRLRQKRFVQILGCIDTPEAHRLLEEWAASAPQPFLRGEARETLAWLLGRSKDKPSRQ